MKKLMLMIATLFIGVSQTLFAVYPDIPKEIHFATEATYPPFEFIDATGKIRGFDIDIANALCEKIKVKCKFSNAAFNSLIPSLNLGKYDAVIAAMGITIPRKRMVAFTDPYYIPTSSFVAKAAKHYAVSDVIGKIVGVQTGSTMETYLKTQYRSRVVLKTYASIQDAFLDLVAGRIDFVFADTIIAKEWLKQNNNSQTYGIVEKPILDAAHFGSGYGIAVRTTEQPLLNALNKALAEIKADGTYARLTKQYFGE